jgi:hypothetical protein
MVLFVVGLGAAGFRDAVFFFTTAFVFLLVTAFVLGARTDFGAAGLAATRVLVAGFFAALIFTDFSGVVFLKTVFLATFFGAAFLATTLSAAVFFAAFLARNFLAEAFLTNFFDACFLAVAFSTAGFLTADFRAAVTDVFALAPVFFVLLDVFFVLRAGLAADLPLFDLVTMISMSARVRPSVCPPGRDSICEAF